MTERFTLSPALIGGHIVECFDNTLYGFFAVMLAPLFFPTTSEYAGYLASYGAFAAGFLSRPLGALCFGVLGDRLGRRFTLLWTMIFVGVPTLIIGFIPSYDTIGLMAPVLLISCRLVQGFFWGGEFTGVNLYIVENASHHHLGQKTGMLLGWGIIGAVIATLVGAFCTMQIMPSWAWRIPFIMGGLSAFVIYWFRRNLAETLAFTEVKKNNELLKQPWKILLSHYKLKLLLGILIAGFTVMPLYASTILGNQLFKMLGYSNTQSLLLNSFAMLINAGCLMLIIGRMADYIGFKRQMMLGAMTVAVVAIPAYHLIAVEHVTLIHVYSFITLLVVSGSIISGCAMPYIAHFFPTNCRYTAMAMSVTLGYALLGGTMPLMGAYLSNSTGYITAPAYWLCFIAITIFIGVWLQNWQYSMSHHDSNNLVSS